MKYCIHRVSLFKGFKSLWCAIQLLWAINFGFKLAPCDFWGISCDVNSLGTHAGYDIFGQFMSKFIIFYQYNFVQYLSCFVNTCKNFKCTHGHAKKGFKILIQCVICHFSNIQGLVSCWILQRMGPGLRGGEPCHFMPFLCIKSQYSEEYMSFMSFWSFMLF